MPRTHDLPQRDATTARLFLAAALLWPLCLWALFNASAPSPVDRRLVTNTTPTAAMKLSFRNVLDRVDVVGYGPTHPRLAVVIEGDTVEDVRHTVNSLFDHTTIDRVFCVVAILLRKQASDALAQQIIGSHPAHKVHVLFDDSKQRDGVEFARILSKSHEDEGLKSPEEDLILVLLQSGTQFTSHDWLPEVTQALIVPPPLVRGKDEDTVSQKLANAVALDSQRVAFDANLTPLISAATASEIAASNGASWSAPVAWAGIALRLPTYLNLPIKESQDDIWVKQLELSLQLWLCGDGVDSLQNVYVKNAPPLPTEPPSLQSTAHVAATFLDGRSQKLWFSTYQQHNSELTFLDWQTALAHAASEPQFAEDIPSRCRSLEWYAKTVNQDIVKVWEVSNAEEKDVASKESKAKAVPEKDSEQKGADPADGPDLSAPIHAVPEDDGPDLSIPIHAELKKPKNPLCAECLEIVQKAHPYDIQFLDASGGHKEHPHMGALDADGKPGYVHNETALRLEPPPPLTETADPTSLRNACSKRDNNYRMLHEKVFVDTAYEKEQAGKDRPKLFCLVYTISPNHNVIPDIRSTWGPKCDGFMVGSNVTDPSLGTVNIIHEGPELYENIWQKVRSMWSYVYDNYYEKYDWFHIGGDDLYLLVENLRYYLESEEIQTAQNGGVFLPNGDEKEQTPLFLGRRFAYFGDRNNIFNSGGSGYTMNKAALKILVVDGLPNMFPHLKDFSEDTRVAQVFRHYGVLPYETKDSAGGERYMPFMPGHHYGYRMPADKKQDWYASYSIDIKEGKGLAMQSKALDSPSSITGADHCAARSVAFHYVKGFSMIRLHALLYGMCPADTL